MADKITTTNILGVGLTYTDSDAKEKTVYLKLDNPKTGLTESDVRTHVMPALTGENPLFLTPEENPFDTTTAILTAYTEQTTKTEYDIGVE